MPNLKINDKTYYSVNEVHIPLADGSGNEDFAYIGSGAKSITANGTHDVKHYGTVNVNVPTGGGGITPTGTKTITANGTYDVTEYASAKVAVPSEEPTIRSLSITANGTYTAPSGVDGYSPISVNVPTGGGGIDTSDATATADDIEGDKTAYVNGVKVTGTLKNLQMVAANRIEDMNQINVNSYWVLGTSPTKCIVQQDGGVGLSVDPSMFGTCKPEDVRQGVTFTSENGLRAAGTLVVSGSNPVLQSKTVTPTTSQQTVKPDTGYDGLSQVTVKGDTNLIASNIKSGVSIFNVLGTYLGESGGGGGGGLPDGISALATGTVYYTTTAYAPTIEHGLGVVPNFFLVVAEGATSISGFNGRMVANFSVKQTLETYAGYYTTCVMSSAGSLTNNTQPIAAGSIDDYFNAQTFKPYGFFQTNKTYRWYAGVLNMIS